jgi:signal transduction histidine kinase
MAEAASLIELELANEENRQFEFLSAALDQLYRTMSWCASRQVMIDLSSGTYLSTHTVVNMTKFFEGFASKNIKFTDSTKLVTGEKGVRIAFDEKMARLALENAKSNATTHGDGQQITIDVELQGSFLIVEFC